MSLFFLRVRHSLSSTLFPYTTLFRSRFRGCCTASCCAAPSRTRASCRSIPRQRRRSEEHTSELQSRGHLVCRLLLEKKKNICASKRSTNLIYFSSATFLQIPFRCYHS